MAFPCLYIYLQCFTPMCYVRGLAKYAHKRDDHYPIYSKLHYGLSVSILWPYYACSYTVAIFPGPIHSFAVIYTEKLAFQ